MSICAVVAAIAAAQPAADAQPEIVTDLTALKVTELRAKCLQLGLETKGKKEELVNRLSEQAQRSSARTETESDRVSDAPAPIDSKVCPLLLTACFHAAAAQPSSEYFFRL